MMNMEVKAKSENGTNTHKCHTIDRSKEQAQSMAAAMEYKGRKRGKTREMFMHLKALPQCSDSRGAAGLIVSCNCICEGLWDAGEARSARSKRAEKRETSVFQKLSLCCHLWCFALLQSLACLLLTFRQTWDNAGQTKTDAWSKMELRQRPFLSPSQKRKVVPNHAKHLPSPLNNPLQPHDQTLAVTMSNIPDKYRWYWI